MDSHPFRAAIEARDLDAVKELFADDVTLHSPISFKPFEGPDAAAMVLAAVAQVFSDFRYTHELAGEGTHALIFEAKVGDREIEGMDLLHLDAEGRIRDLTVMVRPLSAALALRDAMARQLGYVQS